ncbi:unnamed protein product [Closterium sp. NIES-65]|nr:unnamed protein product [Closterium sp. NIES-65]
MPLIHMRVSLAAPTFCTLFPPLVSSPNCTHKRSSLQHRPVTISAAARPIHSSPPSVSPLPPPCLLSPLRVSSPPSVSPLLPPCLLSSTFPSRNCLSPTKATSAPRSSPSHRHLSSPRRLCCCSPAHSPPLVSSPLSSPLLSPPPPPPFSRPFSPLPAHLPPLSPVSPSRPSENKMFEANYSRKLSSLKHRLVTISPDLAASAAAASALPSPPALLQGFLYWRWAFESPHEVRESEGIEGDGEQWEGGGYGCMAAAGLPVKVLVRKMLDEARRTHRRATRAGAQDAGRDEDNTPLGHPSQWSFVLFLPVLPPPVPPRSLRVCVPLSLWQVKVLVRKMLGEENTPQGHLRLILVPIVYNAMALKENLRKVHPPSPACRSCMESSIH